MAVRLEAAFLRVKKNKKQSQRTVFSVAHGNMLNARL